MIITTHGNPKNPAILLLHPMLTSAQFFDFALDQFKDYFLIIPTYSGHHTGSTYNSMTEELATLDEFLSKNNIDHLKTVIGFSLGGNTAWRYFCANPAKIDQVIIDSAPLFKFPKIVKKFFYHKYAQCLQNVRKNPQNAPAELDKCFRGMGKYQQFIAPTVTNASLKNLIEACFSNQLPNLNPATQAKITFIYGDHDVARLCLPLLRKYKSSHFVRPKSLGHCGLFLQSPAEYIKTLIK